MITPIRYEGVRSGVTWRIRFRLGGKYTSETFPTRKQAEVFAADIDYLGAQEAVDRLYEAEQNADVPTFDEYVLQYITDLTRPNAETKAKYRRCVELHWSPELGDTQLHRITRSDIAAVVNGWGADGYSDKSIGNWWGDAVAPAFKMAAQDGVIERNPCYGVKLPRNTEHETDEMVILDSWDLRRLLECMHDDYRALVITLADTGLRWGEAAALTVGDVKQREQTLRVTKAVKKDGSIGPPKTKRSRRTIYYNNTVAEMIHPLTVGRAKDERLFTAPRGGAVRHRTFWSDIWRPAVWKAQHCDEHRESDCRCGTAHPERCTVHVDESPPPCGCDGTLSVTPRIHDLRHTHASALLAAGRPIHAVQDRLGHESIQTTVDTYGHLLPDVQKAAAQVSAIAGPATPALDP